MNSPQHTTLLSLFQQLRAISETLRTALITHDPDGILRAVEKQEQIVNTCHDLRATLQPADRSVKHHPPDTQPAATSELRHLMADIQRLQQTNHRVAAAFLEAVDHTLATLGVGAPRRRVTYGMDGWSRTSSTPVFFQQRG